MVLCEHFIFTSADLKEKSGYQVVSKSTGITPELLSELEGYLYPVGIDPGRLSESKSMLVMKDKVLFTKAKNIGIGYDGRPDTVYSHTIVTNIEDFKQFQYDTRLFEKFYLEIKEQKHLTPLVIEPTKLNPDFSCIDVFGIAQFKDFLRAVFSKKKIAILNTENKNLIQSLISLLPPPFRLISFSTLVTEPQRQSKFELIQTQSSKSSLEKYFVIDPEERKMISPTKDTLFEQCISYLLDIINSKNSTKLTEIYDQFESVPIKNYKEKLSLAVGILILDPKQPSLLDQKAINQLLLLLDKTPSLFISKHFSKLEPFLPENITTEYSTKFETSKLLSDYSKEELTYNAIIKMFDGLSKDTSESRLLLFHQLVEQRTKDFEVNGYTILLDFVNDFYNSDVIIRGFVENEVLHKCIFDTLESSIVDHTSQKKLFKMLVEYSLCHNTDLLEKLFTFKVFDLNNYYDVSNYRDITVELFKATEFHKKLKPKAVFTIIKQIHDIVDSEFPRNKKSGIIDNRFYYMQDILYVLLNTMKYLLSIRKFELKKLKTEIEEEESNLKYFLDLNHLPERNFFTQFNIFNPIPSTLIRNIFSSFTKRCRE